MQIKVRVRVNDVKPDALFLGEFIYFDNCVEVRVGKAKTFGYHRENGQPSVDYTALSSECKNKVINPSTNREFDHLHFMLRHRPTTAKRISEEVKTFDQKHPDLDGGPVSPYHLCIIDWKDRVTGQWHRLTFDTVVFLLNDQGGTLQKVDG
jgi:hypothetical protein